MIKSSSWHRRFQLQNHITDTVALVTQGTGHHFTLFPPIVKKDCDEALDVKKGTVSVIQYAMAEKKKRVPFNLLPTAPTLYLYTVSVVVPYLLSLLNQHARAFAVFVRWCVTSECGQVRTNLFLCLPRYYGRASAKKNQQDMVATFVERNCRVLLRNDPRHAHGSGISFGSIF